MSSGYNRIAGHSIERLAALSDGLFAVAMTLLVLDLRVPAAAAIHAEADLLRALAALAPRLLVYLMSFLTLGIFWVGQQTQLNHLERADRDISWVHLLFLFAVTLMPFSTRLMTAFLVYRTALLVYWGNILLLGAALFASWRCATRSGLVRADAPAGIGPAVERRILVAQGVYALGCMRWGVCAGVYALGAALCVLSTYWSLGFIVLVQLNYALAPRIGRPRAR